MIVLMVLAWVLGMLSLSLSIVRAVQGLDERSHRLEMGGIGWLILAVACAVYLK